MGLIRGCIKTVTCGKKTLLPGNELNSPTLYANVTYILGLRVSPIHMWMGIGLKMGESSERRFKENGAKYTYMATEKENKACIELFSEKLNYIKFQTPAVLVHPMYAQSHSKRIRSSVKIHKLGVQAESGSISFGNQRVFLVGH